MGNFKNLILLVVICISLPASAVEKKGTYVDSIIWGISGAPALLTGSFAEELSTGFALSAEVMLPLPIWKDYFFLYNDVNWMRFSLQDSTSSSMHSFKASTALMYRYKMNRFFQPYGAIGMGGALLYLNAENISQEEWTFKPAPFAEAGILSEVFAGFGFQVSCSWLPMSLSGELFSPLMIKGGVTFRYGGFKERHARLRRRNSVGVRGRLVQAEDAFASGNLNEAMELLEKNLRSDPNHQKSRKLHDKIKGLMKHADTATRLIGEERYFEAIPLLEETAPVISTSARALRKIRAEHGKFIPQWEREGIRAYEKKRYNSCIVIMKKILAIEPGNKVAKIYMPRAMKRKQALERLQ